MELLYEIRKTETVRTRPAEFGQDVLQLFVASLAVSSECGQLSLLFLLPGTEFSLGISRYFLLTFLLQSLLHQDKLLLTFFRIQENLHK